jgi:hypothetical protein
MRWSFGDIPRTACVSYEEHRELKHDKRACGKTANGSRKEPGNTATLFISDVEEVAKASYEATQSCEKVSGKTPLRNGESSILAPAFDGVEMISSFSWLIRNSPLTSICQTSHQEDQLWSRMERHP